MKSQNPKAIADKFYGDPFSRKIRDGNRCCEFGPSIFKSGFGTKSLLIDKETLTVYELPSGFGRFGDLPMLDYENKWGLFTWPDQGGIPIPDEDKILRKEEVIGRNNGADANESQQKNQGVDELEVNISEAEQILFEAAEIEDTNIKLAEELYRKAIALLLKDAQTTTRDNFLMLAYSALGQLHVTQEQFLSAIDPLSDAVALCQSSDHKKELYFVGVVCVQLLADCYSALGRTEELAALAELLDRAEL
ncbi:MAG: hypothetical protein WC714_19065 [Candidatus Obscuribacterales bacterium]|jgi:tetratricopeptide (TPR) repeat protein